MAAGMLVASCSDDNNGLDDDGGISQPSDGEAYVQFSIKLPTTSDVSANGSDYTKANDDFGHGKTAEYAVNKAHLIVFSGHSTDEANAEVVQNSQLYLQPWNDKTSDQVSSEANITAKITGKVINENDSLFAFIVLNGTTEILDLFSPAEYNNGTKTKDGIKFSQLLEKVISSSSCMGDLNSNGFVMMNAPLAINKISDDGSIIKIARTLVPIQDNISASEEEAKGKTACEVYVERGVAKVSLTIDNSINNINGEEVDNAMKTGVDGTTSTLVNIVVANWDLDCTNKSTYVMHNVSDFDTWKSYGVKNTSATPSTTKFRFYGSSVVGTSDAYKNATRIYWAKDPNYNVAVNITDTNYPFDTIVKNSDLEVADYCPYTSLKDNKFVFSVEDGKYLLENTFNTSNMNENQTTRVIVKGIIKSKTDITDLSDQPTLYRVGTDSKLYDLENLEKLIINVCKSKLDIDVKFANTVSFEKEPGLHEIQIGDFASEEEGYTNPVTLSNIDDVRKVLGNIDTFYKGECYYRALIKHFGNDETYWQTGDPTYALGDSDDDIEIAEKKWLGRYGIVRNNWYQLKVSGITSVGTSTIPGKPDTPDDQNQSYINVTCKILSWAVRNQSVVL